MANIVDFTPLATRQVEVMPRELQLTVISVVTAYVTAARPFGEPYHLRPNIWHHECAGLRIIYRKQRNHITIASIKLLPDWDTES